jgi:hypothetical protein
MNQTDQETALLRRRLRAKLREIRRFIRGDAPEAPSSATICVWIELASMLECYDDVLDLSARLFEAETDPFLYRRAQRLVRLAKVKTGAQRVD